MPSEPAGYAPEDLITTSTMVNSAGPENPTFSWNPACLLAPARA